MPGSDSKGHWGKIRIILLSIAIVATILILTLISPTLEHRQLYVTNPQKFPLFENYNTDMEMKDPVIGFVRQVSESHYQQRPLYHPFELRIEADWEVKVTLYYKGDVKGEGSGKGDILSFALEEATIEALKGDMEYEDMNYARFKIDFLSPFRFSVIEYKGEAIELIGDLAPLREMDKQLIREKIDEAKQYLFRVIDENPHGGAHKYYYALDDEFENRVHCIYSSSLTFSLMRIYDYDQDEGIWDHIDELYQFISFMQNTNEKSKAYGGFHYSYYIDTDEKEQKYVVGTTSKTIFTLLELYERTGEKEYLEKAELGADWLLTMQKEDGTMKAQLRYDPETLKWYSVTKFSFLYNGQVLSALSRMYRATGNQEYYDAAEKIAEIFLEKIDEQGYYLGDEFRVPNPISSSWAILALFDFYKASNNESYMDIVLENSGELLGLQMEDSSDILTHGRWSGSMTTSGCGWLNEVYMELYNYCKGRGIGRCDDYKEAITKATRWILQHTYSEQNSYYLPNPGMAIGGAYWNQQNKYVRTDSVCHAVNAYAGIYSDLDDGTLISLPDVQLADLLEEARDKNQTLLEYKNTTMEYDMTLGPIEDALGAPIVNAQVTWEMKGGSKSEYTDSSGHVTFSIPEASKADIRETETFVVKIEATDDFEFKENLLQSG
jgi:rhamnogalacturonyl hydrolase YesR